MVNFVLNFFVLNMGFFFLNGGSVLVVMHS